MKTLTKLIVVGSLLKVFLVGFAAAQTNPDRQLQYFRYRDQNNLNVFVTT